MKTIINISVKEVIHKYPFNFIFKNGKWIFIKGLSKNLIKTKDFKGWTL